MIAGRLPIPPKWDIFLVSQQLPDATDVTPLEEVLSADPKRSELLAQQALLDDEVTCAEGACDADRFAQASQRLLEVQDDLTRWDVEEEAIIKILVGLGFAIRGKKGSGNVPTLRTPMHALSCGWRMKVQLAKALWLRPKLLLLDEPTNHLDLHALLWLEARLQEYPNTVVIVSHDVSFLHSTCWEILWLHQRKLESMPRDAVTQEDLARMQRNRPLNFRFTIPDDCPEAHGVSFHDVEFDYGSTSSCKKTPTLRVPGNVRLSGNSRCALLGRNGSGKSTFLGLCAGKLNHTRGSVDRTPGCKIGHYSQEVDMFDENVDETAAKYLVRECREALERKTGIARPLIIVSDRERSATVQEKRPSETWKRTAVADERALFEAARGVLSQFGFEGDAAVGIPAHRLSGGQKACLKLAALSLQPSHILFLDEPTNHLDAEAREALTKGLAEFKGGIVVVTHDDTLVYRLLQCSWSKSELVICQNGNVHCEKNFSGHRLQALKDDVRRAGEAEATAEAAVEKKRRQVVRPPKLQAVPMSLEIEPTTPPGFFRVSAKPQIQKTETVAKASAAASRATRLANKAKAPVKGTATLESAAREKSPERVEKRVHRVCASRPSAWEARRLAPKAECADAFPSLTQLATRNRAVELRKVICQGPPTLQDASLDNVTCGHAIQERDTDVPDDWEAIADSDNESIPSMSVTRSMGNPGAPETTDAVQESVNSIDELAAVEPARVHIEAKCVATSSILGSTTQIKQNDSKDCPSEVLLGFAPRGSGHSRVRKDLVNLDKAVAKWLRQEQEGCINLGDLVSRIRSSPAAQHLRTVHGTEFREENFIAEVIGRAAGKR
jgi:ATPase subunit of ABC transporter with duplicated ATPase domains